MRTLLVADASPARFAHGARRGERRLGNRVEIATLIRMAARYAADSLIAFARTLLVRAGLDEDKASAVATILVEADLLGHTTHGLALLSPYLAEIEKGSMTRRGEPRMVADFPAAITWDAGRLPGPWVVQRALEVAVGRAAENGTCVVSIRRSHHIACLAAYLRPVTERGMMVILTCSDPSVASVAPYGGRQAVFTPNPLAAAWPTDGDPVMMDTSMSITTNALTNRLRAERGRFPGQWALDNEGRPTDDPEVLFSHPPGTLLPIGGIDHGHKGYTLALLVEALTGCLAGHGRADPSEGWGASILVQVFDPRAFGGLDQFRRQATRLAEMCRANPPRGEFEAVRMPGESALRRRREQLAAGVELYPSILPSLATWASRFGVPLPASL